MNVNIQMKFVLTGTSTARDSACMVCWSGSRFWPARCFFLMVVGEGADRAPGPSPRGVLLAAD